MEFKVSLLYTRTNHWTLSFATWFYCLYNLFSLRSILRHVCETVVKSNCYSPCVCPSICLHWTGGHPLDKFSGISYLELLLIFVSTFWFWLELNKNDMPYMKAYKHLCYVSLWLSFVMCSQRYGLRPKKKLMIEM